jgi:hypothetical protein
MMNRGNVLLVNRAAFFDAQGRRWNGVMTNVDETRAAELPAQFRLSKTIRIRSISRNLPRSAQPEF